MRLFLSYLPALACAGLMFVCIGGMGVGRKDRGETAAANQIAELRAEVERFRAEQAERVEGDKLIGPRP